MSGPALLPTPTRPAPLAPLALLAPQRQQPTVGLVASRLGISGPVAVVTAGWQEREAEVGELADHLLAEAECRAVPLELYRRGREVFAADPALADAHRRRQDRLRALQTLHRAHLTHRIAAVDALAASPVPSALRDPERRLALAAVGRLDDHHRSRLAAVHAEFAAEAKPLERPAVSDHRRHLAELMANCAALAIAGGHVAVLLNRLRLFGLSELLAERPLPILAWSGGAMVLADSLVVFHDRPPQGRGNAEVLDVGLGFLPGVQPLPHATRRLLLDDPGRVSLLAHRFPRPVALDSGGHLVFAPAPETDGFRLLLPDGGVRPLQASDLTLSSDDPSASSLHPSSASDPNRSARVGKVDEPPAPLSEVAHPTSADRDSHPGSPLGRIPSTAPHQAAAPSTDAAYPEDAPSETPPSQAPPPVAGVGTSSPVAWGSADGEEVPTPSTTAPRRPSPESPAAPALTDAPLRPLAIRALQQADPPPSPTTLDAFLDNHSFPLSEGTTTTFVYRGEADEVRLRHWIYGLPSSQPFERLEGTDLWFRVMEIPERSRVEYKIELVEDGEERWIQDPLNPLTARDPFGANSVFHGVGYATPIWTVPDPEVRQGRFEEITVDSTAFGAPVTSRVYLPARFRPGDPGPGRRYPLIVFHDGEDYARYAALVPVLDNLVERLEVAPPIVVLSDPREERLEEYGDDPRHARYLAEELLPALEARYPLLPGPAGRGLAGASFGAVASLAAAWRYPGTWGRLLLQSGSFAFSDVGGAHRRGEVFDPVVRFMNRFREEPRRPAEKLFLSCGIYESLIYENRSLVPLLQEAGMEVRYREARDGHNWENWRDRLRAGLSWLFPGPLWMVYE